LETTNSLSAGELTLTLSFPDDTNPRSRAYAPILDTGEKHISDNLGGTPEVCRISQYENLNVNNVFSGLDDCVFSPKSKGAFTRRSSTVMCSNNLPNDENSTENPGKFASVLTV